VKPPQILLASHAGLPGSAYRVGLQWSLWVLLSLAMLAALARSAVQWQRAQRAHESTAVPTPATVMGAQRSQAVSPSQALERHPQIDDPKAATLQALHMALQSAGAVQLVSAEFSPKPAASADQLDRLDASIQLRGPYAAVKQVLAQWSDRFAASSVIALRVQRSDTLPGVVDATLSAALWSKPAKATDAAPAASAPRTR
jgi:hypothetical protein